MIFILIQLINILRNILILIIFVDALLSFFMSPLNPIRMTLDRIVTPMLSPIRRVVPPIGGTLDLSPLILIILIEIISSVLIRLLTLL